MPSNECRERAFRALTVVEMGEVLAYADGMDRQGSAAVLVVVILARVEYWVLTSNLGWEVTLSRPPKRRSPVSALCAWWWPTVKWRIEDSYFPIGCSGLVSQPGRQ